MEYIVNHELYEEIRIAKGLYLKVHKYSHIDNNYHDMYNLRKSIVQVAPKIYRATKNIVLDYYRRIGYSEGTFFINGYAVKNVKKKIIYIKLQVL